MVSCSKIHNCPACYRKLCKTTEREELGTFIEFKHKGSMVLTSEAVIMCPQCHTNYLISAENGIEREVKLKG